MEDYVVRYNFSGGLNDDLFATLIGEDQLVQTQNLDHRQAGQIQTIDGHAQIGNTAVSGSTGRTRGLFDFVTSGGTNYLCTISSEATPHLWTIKSGDSTFTDQGALTGFTAGNECYASQLRSGSTNYLFIADGAGRPWAWDGSALFRAADSASDTTVPPSGTKGFVNYMNRLFAWKGDRLYFSRPLFPLTTASAGAFSGGWNNTVWILDVGAGRGENIVHCEAFRNEELIVFMDRSIWRITQSQANVFGVTYFGNQINPSFIILPVSTKIGCSAQSSVVQIGSDMFFRDQEGHIRSLRRTIQDEGAGGIDPVPLSQPIRQTIDDSAALYYGKTASVYWKGQYQISMAGPAQTDVSQTSTFNVRLQSWAGAHTWAATRFVRSSWTGQLKCYFTKPENNLKVYELDSGTSFDGSAISIALQSRRENHSKPWQKKVGKFAVFFFQTGDSSAVTIEAATDGGTFQALPNNVVDLSGGAGALPSILPFTLGGDGVLPHSVTLKDLDPYFDIQFQITSSDLDVLVKFLGYIIVSDLREVKQSFIDFGATGSAGN